VKLPLDGGWLQGIGISDFFSCFIVLLFYCFIVLLFYCFIVLLFYCFIVLLFYCFIVCFIGRLFVSRDIWKSESV
jgi:hypothetical protein